MAFKIPKEEYINRTFRLRKELVDRMEVICNEKKHLPEQVDRLMH